MVRLDVWLYGPLSRYAGPERQGAYARLDLEMPDGVSMADLLAHLGMPVDEKGLTFVNGSLTDMPGMAADLEKTLADGDRVAFFHERSMWPFQYRFGASVSPELNGALLRDEGGALRHSTAPPSREPKPS